MNVMEYSLNQQSSYGRMFDGVVTNISESGLCLFTTTPLELDQEITMMNYASFSPCTESIRWSEAHQGLYHRVGLEFH